jgi:hypothetical protein
MLRSETILTTQCWSKCTALTRKTRRDTARPSAGARRAKLFAAILIVEHINTSYVERQNLSMRMGIRRFTRLTNAFSKKLENHIHALSIYFMHYNFVRIHQTIRCSPAMEAGVTDRLWSLEDMVRIVDEWEANQKEAL